MSKGIIYRPAIITRRAALITGAAALATLPREARAANAVKWNSADKSTDITLLSNQYFGADTVMYNPATAGWRSVRSTWSASSGKIFVQVLVLRKETHAGSAIVGVGNASATLGSYCGSDANGLGFQSSNSYLGGVNLGANAGRWLDKGTDVINLAINLTNGRVSMQSYALNSGTAENNTTWYDGAAGTGDPTSSTFGTLITGITGAIYVMASALFQASDNPIILINGGGWPFIEGTTVPSGYSPPDAAYPFTIPVGAHSITRLGTSMNSSQNNLRAYATQQGASADWRSVQTDAVLPANSKTMFEVTFERGQPAVSSVGLRVILFDNTATITGAPTPAFLWQGDGSVQGGSAGEWDNLTPGCVAALVVRKDVNRAWGKVVGLGSSGNWNKDGSADPATNTNGKDISGISGLATIAPGIGLYSEYANSAVINLGAQPSATTLPSGIVSVEDAFVSGGGRPRSTILQ